MRLKTYKKYSAKYATQKDNRNMDEICNTSSDFTLQVQQKFLRDWMAHHQWNNILLYHEIGSGKTCTSIVMAEEYLKNHSGKILVILPARLRTNYLDELISACGANKYISQEDFDKYNNESTSKSMKAKIRTVFMKEIEKYYEIMSIEQFRMKAETAPDLKVWAEKLTKNRLIIIDEVHNLINPKYNPQKYEEMLQFNKIPLRITAINSMLFKYLTSHAHESCKMIFMTATPIFDNILQFKELVSIMRPDINVQKLETIKDATEALRGRVSYFPGTSPNAYPEVEYVVHDIKMSNTQKDIIEKIIIEKSDKMNDTKESFYSKQRQVSIACLPGNRKVVISKVLENLKEYAPKLIEIYKQINLPGKHMVYSNFIKHGLDIVEGLLKSKGWVCFPEIKPNKTYAKWDASVKDQDKQLIKNTVNHISNMSGEKIKVILGSPSVKEGVSFKHIQGLHILDPVWNQSAKTQVEGRAIRFCSHVDIPISHPVLKRKVIAHVYKLRKTTSKIINLTCDELIYDVIIPKKYEQVSACERALQKVAIDYFLFRKMYTTGPKTPEETKDKSPLELDENSKYTFAVKKHKDPKTSCPKPRRPDDNGKCEEGKEARLNKKGDLCCYKIKKNRKQ